MRVPLIHKLAPALTGLLLVVFMVSLRVSGGPTEEQLDVYFAEVKQKVEAIPLRLGPYLGVPREVAPAAEELLKPNIILQRQYTDPDTGLGFSLVLVHSGVVRDMHGHYPPICYPRHGWDGGVKADVPVTLGEEQLTGRVYRYTRTVDVVEETVEILNLFATPHPDTPYGYDSSVVERASRSRLGNRMGAAQVQVLTPPRMSEAERAAVWSMVMDAVAPAMQRVAAGIEADASAEEGRP